MIKENEFIWKEHKSNNIDTNPLEEIYCIVDIGDSAKKYSIKYQMFEGDGFPMNSKDKAQYYILFETNGKKATTDDKKDWFYKSCHYDNYLFKNETFIKVFTSLEEAKKRAYQQYSHIYGGILKYIVDDVEDATKNHFVV